MCIYFAVGRNDDETHAKFLADKVSNLRIFDDDQGKMNRSAADIGGELLVVSEFTLYGDCAKGNRPSFSDAAPPGDAQRLYDYFIKRLRGSGLAVATGQFHAKMNVSLTNDGPVTFILEA